MTTQAFPIVLLGGCIFGCIMFLIGRYNGYFLGVEDGFCDGYRAAQDDYPEVGNLDDIRWRMTVPPATSALPVLSDLSDPSDPSDLQRDFH